jgi:hypothetical protein
MTSNEDLLSLVQPAGGWFAVLGIKNDDDVKQKLVETREEVNRLTEQFVSEDRNVYFGVAKFASDESRKKVNVKALKAFWLDIDCGESKVVINPKTGFPDGYIDQATGLTALRSFCKLLKLPKPVLVNSGRGLHVYWPLTEEVTREQWEPVANRLRELCVQHDFYIDGKVFEVARVLRIPGTYNFKDEPPTSVDVISLAPPVDFEQFRLLLGAPKPRTEEPKRELSELAKSLVDNMVSSFRKIMIRSGNGTGCQQLLDAYEQRAELSEPRWFAALSIAKFCADKDRAIHKMSEGHPDYTPEGTEKKIAHIVGPHTCTEFEKANPGGCADCPHKGKIKSPIVLGKEVQESTEEEQEEAQIPKFPDPFFRGKNGGIYMALGDENEPIRIYEHDLYVVKRMRDPVYGDVVVLKLHLPRDGVKEFIISNAHITDKNECRRVLASHGVVCGSKSFSLLIDYIIASIRELQFKRKAEQMRQQFGWTERDSVFVIGDREISVDGIYHSPPSSVTQNLANYLQPTGTLAKWREVFELYGKEGLEPHAFAALTAFGSPLLKFLGQNGAIINVIHPSSGTGKTTILHMCNSVYGDPVRLCSMWEDTLNAKFLRLGVMNNLPFTIDEMTNTSPAEFSTLAYGMSQGRGKDRVKAASNELRANLTSWRCISLCSSNASFYEKLSALKHTPDGEMMRLLEYKIEYSNAIPTDVAKQMFDHQLKENFGHAGDLYVRWLVGNLEEAKQTLLGIQAKLDKELKLTQRERFWSAVVAANITGGLIAKNLGLINWDMKAIYKWAAQLILSLRVEVKPPASDAVAVLGDYINRHMQNVLVVDDAADGRTNLLKQPLLEPKGDLLIRYEPDTQKMFIAAKQFKEDCVKFQVNYKDTLYKLEKRSIYLGTTTKRLSKGMKIMSPGVHCLMFNCANSDFISMDGLVDTEASYVGGEG